MKVSHRREPAARYRAKPRVLAIATGIAVLGTAAGAHQASEGVVAVAAPQPQLRLEGMSETGIALVETSREVWRCGTESLVVDRAAAPPRNLTFVIDGAIAPTKATDDLMREFNERDIIRVDVFACPYQHGASFTVELFQFAFQGKNICLGRFKIQKAAEAIRIPYEEGRN